MTLFVLFHFLICIFLVAVILIQPGKGDAGIGFGSSSQSVFGSRGAGNFLTKLTSISAALFLATSFFLTRSRIQQTESSVINRVPEPTAPAVPAPAPATAPQKAPVAPQKTTE